MIIVQGSLASGGKAPQSTEVFHLITDGVLLIGAVLKLNPLPEILEQRFLSNLHSYLTKEKTRINYRYRGYTEYGG